MRRLMCGILASIGGVLAAAPAAHADVTWLCYPGMADNPCEIPTDTTVREPDGSEHVETPARLPESRRPIDCFYVYPTVSNQPTANANKARDPELVSIAKYQAARFSSQCRIFAPIYRQGTVPGLLAAGQGAQTPEQTKQVRQIAYSDVLEAWRYYLAHENHRRGVVLLGHSQGTRMFRALLKLEIDASPAQRRLIVGGVLLGGNVTVPRGRAVGGDFKQVPVCTRRGEVGCVVAFSSFAADPPEDTRFGKVRSDPADPWGFPSGAGYQVACTDPGVLSGLTRPFGITLPSEPFAPGFIGASIFQSSGGPPPSASTTWVESADRYQGKCRVDNGANVLRFDPVGDSRRPNPSPNDTWGTHIIDMNLGLERQVAIVGRQARGWLRGAGGAGCLAASGRARGRRLGPAVLRRSRTRQRRALRGVRLRSRRGTDRYCLAGGGSLRITYKRRRATLILSSGRGYSVRGIRPGMRAAAARRRRRTGAVRPVFRIRSGRVVAVGITSASRG